MLDLVMNNAIDAVVKSQLEETEERTKQYKRKEFEITTKYGARETRYIMCNHFILAFAQEATHAGFFM